MSGKRPLSAGKIVALQRLMQAYADAKDTKKPVWEFAVRLPGLLEAGATETDLRWLVARRYVEQAVEETRGGATERSFRLATALTFGEDTCFVLSEAGGTYVKHHRVLADRVRWDSACRELRVGDKVAKRFLRDAPAQRAVLEAFQAANWQRRVDVRLPANGHRDPTHRLREVVAELNKGLDQSLIRFRMDGLGEGVIYDHP